MTKEEEAPQHSKNSRMFVRNLPFEVNDRMLRKLFNQYGEIIDVL